MDDQFSDTAQRAGEARRSQRSAEAPVLTRENPDAGGGCGVGRCAREEPPAHAAAIANAFGTTFWVAPALTAAALLPALLLPAKPKDTQSADPPFAERRSP
jgi:hypothetical protein